MSDEIEKDKTKRRQKDCLRPFVGAAM